MIERLFGGINMTWKRVILFALGAAVYTALMALFVPQTSSFHDIVVTSETWAFFAIFIFINCKTPKEAALKVFVFFLISQPLIYIFQIPFHKNGVNLLTHYPFWFLITVLTAPSAYLGWHVKKNNIVSALILSISLIIILYYGVHYFSCMVLSFPNHLLTVLLCAIEIPLLIFGILKDNQARKLAIIFCVIWTIIFAVKRFSVPFINKTLIVYLDPEKYPIDHNWSVIPRDESVSTADLMDTYNGCALCMHFYNTENNVITLFDNHHHEYRLDISCNEDLSVNIKDRKPYISLFGLSFQR